MKKIIIFIILISIYTVACGKSNGYIAENTTENTSENTTENTSEEMTIVENSETTEYDVETTISEEKLRKNIEEEIIRLMQYDIKNVSSPKIVMDNFKTLGIEQFDCKQYTACLNDDRIIVYGEKDGESIIGCLYYKDGKSYVYRSKGVMDVSTQQPTGKWNTSHYSFRDNMSVDIYGNVKDGKYDGSVSVLFYGTFYKYGEEYDMSYNTNISLDMGKLPDEAVAWGEGEWIEVLPEMGAGNTVTIGSVNKSDNILKCIYHKNISFAIPGYQEEGRELWYYFDKL